MCNFHGAVGIDLLTGTYKEALVQEHALWEPGAGPTRLDLGIQKGFLEEVISLLRGEESCMWHLYTWDSEYSSTEGYVWIPL